MEYFNDEEVVEEVVEELVDDDCFLEGSSASPGVTKESLYLLDDNPSGDSEDALRLLADMIDDDEYIVEDDEGEYVCTVSSNPLFNTSVNAVLGSSVMSNTNICVPEKGISEPGTKLLASKTQASPGSKNKTKRRKKTLIPYNAKEYSIAPDDPFGIKRDMQLDANLTINLPTTVRFRGNLNATFLIIVDSPSFEDADPKVNLIDSKRKIIGPIENSIHDFYTEIFTYNDGTQKRKNPKDYSVAMVSLCMGWHGDKFRNTPTAPEIAASAPHLKKIIKNMHNLRLVYVMGKYSEELLIHHLCPYRMYSKPKGGRFHKHDLPSETMTRRNNTTGKFSHVYMEDDSFRYFNLPYPTSKLFKNMVADSLHKLEKKRHGLIKYPCSSVPYDIRDAPLNMKCDPKDYYTAESFREHLYSDMRYIYDHRRRVTMSRRNMSTLLDDGDDCSMMGIPSPQSYPISSSSITLTQTSLLENSGSLSMTNTYDRIADDESLHLTHPTGLFRDVSLDPYLNTHTYDDRYICMKQTKYDYVNNVLNMYCHTPSGNPILTTVKDATFTFWVKPHVNFAETATLWAADEKNLRDEHLTHLRKHLSKKLYYVIKDREHTIMNKDGTKQDPFTLSFAYGHHDYKEGYWHDREFVFIRIDVRNYSFIQPIINQLKKLIHTESSRKKEKFVTYQVYSPEHMLTYKYNWLMSHWFRVRGLTISTPFGIDTDRGVYHSRVLYGEFSVDDKLGALTLLDPAANIPIGKTGLTSSDMPPSIRAAFDIETWFERGVRDFDNTPIICICIAVRKHHPLTTKFDSETKKDENGEEIAPFPTFVPLDGYVYYTFMMGDAAPPTQSSNHLGPEFIFSFMREDDLIRSFYLLRRLLMADYVETHNGENFDDPKIYNRAIMLGIDIENLGFREDEAIRLVNTTFQSKAHGERQQWFFEGTEGIVSVDTLQVAFRELKRRSYKLNSLAYDYAGKMTKHDMPYDAIKGHWIKNPETRRKLINYCTRDAQLPDQIINCRQTIPTMCELARVTGNVPEDKIHKKGMQEKVLGSMMQTNFANGGKVLIPTTKSWMKQHNEDVENYYQKKLEAEIAAYLTGGDAEIVGLNNAESGRKIDDDDLVVADITSALNRVNLSGSPASGAKSSSSRSSSSSSSSSSSKKQRTATPTLSTTHPPSSSKSPTAPNWFIPLSAADLKQNDDKRRIDEGPVIYAKDKKKGRVVLGRGGNAVVRKTLITSYLARTTDPPPSPPESELKLKDDPKDAMAEFTNTKSLLEEDRKRVQHELSKANSENNALTKKADYAGAVVMKVQLGWHRKRPMGCVDFASLYPSIIMANNLDSNTKVFEDEMILRGVTNDMVYPAPSELMVMNPRTKKRVKVYCVKPEYRKGLLAETEITLVAKRGVAKNLISKYQNQYLKDGVTLNPDFDKNKADVMEQRSNGLKLIGNSGYGIKGTETDVGDKHIAAMVTAYGRDYITLTRRTVERRWFARCRGGDTDSIFMEFEGNDEGDFQFNTVEELEAFADEWVKELNKLFRHPVKIDYEKAMDGFAAISKKRYIYWLCLKGKKPKLTYKGLETVRRDSLPFTKETMEKLFKILQARCPEDLKPAVQSIRDKYLPKIAELESQVLPLIKLIYNVEDGPKADETVDTIYQELRVKMRGEETAKEITDTALFNLLAELRRLRVTMTVEVNTYRDERIDAWTNECKKKAIEFIRVRGNALLNGDVADSDLILSKCISREYYANQKQEHLTVVKKLDERGLPTPNIGDRVCFVYTKMPIDPATRKPRKGYEIADDPEWVIKNEIPIDYIYYFEHKFIKPVVNVLKYFLMDDMANRIAVRQEKNQLFGSAFKTQIKMKDIAEETEKFLFNTIGKRDFCNPHGKKRYLEATGYKIVSAKSDTNDKNSIFSFMKAEKPTVEEHMKQYSFKNKKEAALHLRVEYKKKVDSAKRIHARKKEELDTIHKHCRTCLAISDDEPVLCKNSDCLEVYHKRLLIEGQEVSRKRELNALKLDYESLPSIRDIEDLF